MTLPLYRLTPLLWLSASVALYLGGAHLYSFLSHSRTRQIIVGRAWPLLIQALYYLGLPYVALLRGDVLPRLLGLTDLDWIADIGAGVGLGFVMIVLALGSFRYAGLGVTWPAPARQRRSGAVTWLWQAIILQSHAAFYRATLIPVFDNLYWGAFASLIPQALEIALDPRRRRRLSDEAEAPLEIARWSILLGATALYLFARNLPLLIALSWLAEMGIAAVAASRPAQAT